MRVELTVEVFTDPDDESGTHHYDPHDLYDLLRCFVHNRHDWVTNSLVVAAVEAFLPQHLPTLADTYVALARKAAVGKDWTGTSQAGEVVRVGRADLGDYSADLCQPAVLVVENQHSDGFFLHAVAHVFGHERIITALRERWVEIHNGGGSSLVKVAEAAAARYRRVVRVVALLDSDRLIPRQRTGSHDKADKLTKMKVAVHVLDRREAENYVPYRVLAQAGRRPVASRRLAFLKRLTQDQREHFDMKHGFKKVRPAVQAAQRDLFDALDLDVRLGLHDGFGQDLLQRMHNDRERLTEHDFAQLGDEVVAELRALLATLASRI